MRSGRIAAFIATAVLAPALAACGGNTSADTSASATDTPASTTKTPARTEAADPAAASGGLTPAGTRLGLGKEATVAWVPPSDSLSSNGAQKGLKVQVTVESIEKGSIGDFKNISLDASERTSTPYYVKVRIKALGSVAPKGTDDPDLTFDAIDDRGQQQSSVTFLGTFDRCDDTTAPKPFVDGKSYESCLAYLMPGGGSIQKVQWNSGPSAADEVTPYFEKPVVWSAS